jgi:hypothetical protein
MHTKSTGYPCENINEKLVMGDLVAMENTRGIMTWN